jgi:repressor LexA
MFEIRVNLNISEVHKNTLEVICDYILSHHRSPTVREIAALTGRSLQPTQLSLDILRQKGYLNWSEGQARTMFVTLDKI